MITFILNREKISADLPGGMPVLDFLRRSQRLSGTKEGCREGDCGACLILLGKLDGKGVSYEPVNSCLLPLAELHGKHVVTIEGLNTRKPHDLNPIQQAIAEEGATQCGYCTPGIVIALTAFFCNQSHLDENEAYTALDGNICRCTGYQAIKRAADKLCKKLVPVSADIMENKSLKPQVEALILPRYFLRISDQLQNLAVSLDNSAPEDSPQSVIVAGGTDLWVQRPEELYNARLTTIADRKDLKGIRIERERCYIGAATTVEEMKNSQVLQKIFPKIPTWFKLIASTPVRLRATLGGNIVNASPCGDLIIFFLGLDASITLSGGQTQRRVALKDFFKDYKQIDKYEHELVRGIDFPLRQQALFNFEKISKRAHLDIACVNSAMQLVMENDTIKRIHLSAGGVSPIPLYLERTVNYLKDKKIRVNYVGEAASIAQSEIYPISDVRGSAKYKRLLVRQLIYAHFITMFATRFQPGDLP